MARVSAGDHAGARGCLRDAHLDVVLGCRLVDGARNLFTGRTHTWPAGSGQCDNRDAAAHEVLLILQVRVGRDQYLEPRGLCGSQQFTVFEC